MTSSNPKSHPFNQDYFSTGPYARVAYSRYSQYWWSNRYYAILAKRYGPKQGRVLELGCGTGRALVPLAEAGYEILGVDISTPEGNVIVGRSVHNDTSPPLRDLKPSPIRGETEREANANPRIPHRHVDQPDPVAFEHQQVVGHQLQLAPARGDGGGQCGGPPNHLDLRPRGERHGEWHHDLERGGTSAAEWDQPPHADGRGCRGEHCERRLA